MTERIGYLVPEFPTQTHAFFWREICALEEMGAEVHVLSTRRPDPEACPHAFRNEAIARTTYMYPPSLFRAMRAVSSVRAMAAGMQYAARLSRKPSRDRLREFGLVAVAADLVRHATSRRLDHIHIHSCANAAHLGAMSRVMGGPPYSLTLHGDLPIYGTDHNLKFPNAAFVSAVTRALAKEVKRVAPGVRAPVIMMGVDTDAFRPIEAAHSREKKFEIISIARLHRAKGHRYVLRALRQLRTRKPDIEISYRVVGEGPERGEIEAEADRLGIQDVLIMSGTRSEDEVRALLSGADVLALASTGKGEAAPVAVMEAMAMGLPVIVSAIGGTPDMIEHGRNGFLVPQKDVIAIAETLGQLAGDPASAQSIGQAARQTAVSKFDYRANAGMLLSEIERSITDSKVN